MQAARNVNPVGGVGESSSISISTTIYRFRPELIIIVVVVIQQQQPNGMGRKENSEKARSLRACMSADAGFDAYQVFP
jgi:hypothetical protein